MKKVFLKLKESSIPAIALKADRLHAESIDDLQRKMDLEDPFEKVVRTLSQSHERVVVLIDQIDALSQSLSTKRDYLDTYTLLVKKLIAIDRVRVIISVRAYDLNYDDELRFYKNQKSIEVGLLDTGQVTCVLAKLGIRDNQIPKQLHTLLQTPQHLNVLCMVYDDLQTNLQSISTLHDLYECLWSQRIDTVPTTSPANSDECSTLVFDIAKKMGEEQRISTLSKPFSRSFPNEFNYLKSSGMVTETDQEVQFFHQTFFDFSFAKQFFQNGTSVTNYILKNHQGLFIRSSLKMIIGFLRNEDPTAYIKALETILFSSKYRFHIRLMLLNLLGFEEIPTAEEKQLVKERILPNKEVKRPFIESVTSKGWFVFLLEEGELDKLAIQKNTWYNKLAERNWGKLDKLASTIKTLLHYQSTSEKWVVQRNLLWQMLIKQLPKNRQSVCTFLLSCADFKGKSTFIFHLLGQVKAWDFPEAFQLFEEHEVKTGTDHFRYCKVLENALNFNLDWAIQKYTFHCHNQIDAIKSVTDEPHFEHEDEQLFKKMFQVDANTALVFTLDIIKRISAKTHDKDPSKLYIDFGFWLFDYERDGHPSYDEAIYHLLIDEVKEQAKQTTPWFDQFFTDHLNSNSVTILRLLFFGFLANPAHYTNQIIELMELFYQKGGLELEDKIQFQFRQLVTAAYPNFDNTQKDQIDRMLLSIESNEPWIYKDKNEKRSIWKGYGYKKYSYLSAVPKTEVYKRPLLKKTFLELERKFNGFSDTEPNTIRTSWIGPPLDSTAYNKMTFDQWEQTFEKYNATYRPERTAPKGSILEHSRAFQTAVKKRALRFFPFIEKLIDENKVEHQYIIAGLTGLIEAQFDPAKVQRIYKKAFSIPFDEECTRYFVWLSSYLAETKILDKDVLEYLIKIATEHPDPVGDTIRYDALIDSANNVRGSAVRIITGVSFNAAFENLIFNALNQITEDPNLSVRVATISRLARLKPLNEQKTFGIFLKLVSSNELEIIKHAVWSVQFLVNNHFDQLTDYFQWALKIESIHGSIAGVLGMAWLEGKKGSDQLLNALLKVSDEAKAELVAIATKNLGDKNERIQAKCHQIFLRFLRSTNQKVMQRYSIAFYSFSPEMFCKVYPLLQQYARSNVAKKKPRSYFAYLHRCVKKHPVECLELLQYVNTYDTPDISKGHYDGSEPVRVLIGIYNSLLSLKKKRRKQLNKTIALFDTMLKSQKFRGAANKVIDQVEM